MKLICFSFSDKGKILGEELVEKFKDKYIIKHFNNRDMEEGINFFLKYNWNSYDGFIFISATGICLRYIAPFIKDKKSDPAILVIDDTAKFCIPILSGHIGGANELANNISKEIGSIPVITTASDNRNIESIDLFAKKNDYYMEDMESIKNITAMMINGKSIGFFSEENSLIEYKNIKILSSLDDNIDDLDGVIIVSSTENIKISKPFTILRPKNISIGLGCRKGVEGKRIIESIYQCCKKLNLSTKSIKNIGTVEIKANEKGILDTVKYFKVNFKIFTIEEISKVDYLFSKSEFVKEQIGVYSVSEPCAYLLNKNLILEKSIHGGITVSISKEEKNE